MLDSVRKLEKVLAKVKECPNCKEIFIPTNKNQKYCNNECAVNVGNRQSRERYQKVDHKEELRECANKNCSNTFMWSSSVPHKKFCEPDCGFRAMKMRDKERSIVGKYNKLDEKGRKMIDEILNLLVNNNS